MGSDKDYMYQEAVRNYDTSLPENPSIRFDNVWPWNTFKTMKHFVFQGDIAYEEDKTKEEYKTYASDKHQRQMVRKYLAYVTSFINYLCLKLNDHPFVLSIIL